MNIISILSSLNIIGLVAFLITLGFLLYEIYLLSRTKKTEDMPHVPSFEEGAQPLPPTMQLTDTKWHNPIKNLNKNNKLLLLTLSILLFFFGSFTVISSLISNKQPENKTVNTPTKTMAKNIFPTSIFPTKPAEDPTPSEITPEEPTVEPTVEITEAVISEEFTPTEEISEEPVTSALSPTVITKLPVTSNVYNSLILFSMAGLFLFFSFLM